ncbi:MAG: mechanosensitive ion channel domain-containing protein [Microgenomates group bacterium]
MDYYNRIVLKLSPAAIEKAIQITIIFIASLSIILLLQRAVGLFFGGLKNRSRLTSYVSRINTMESLINNTIMFVVLSMALLISMRKIGLDVTPIITGAGIIGLAISFGAQTIVRDLISGFFIIVENQYNIGDDVKINDTKGEVRKINLRTTELKDVKGNAIFLPNSEIKSVLVYKKP